MPGRASRSTHPFTPSRFAPHGAVAIARDDSVVTLLRSESEPIESTIASRA
jgi:hypothetical protein